jgi:predicted nucleic acid-binding protein
VPRAVLDTNVLFSRVLHELIGRVATTGNLLELIWSDELVEETTRTLIHEKGLSRENAELWIGLMTDAFPANSIDIARIPPGLDLSSLTSDEGDHHICALAVAGAADYILTFDQSFNRSAMQALGIDVVEPDVFLSDAIDEDRDLFREILIEQAAAWGGRTVEELIDAIERTKTPVFAAKARQRDSRTGNQHRGVKIPLGLWDGSTENKTVTAHLLADLVDRGLDVEQGILVVLDGSKALRAAVNDVFGPVPLQRCIRHKERNVLDHLPERDRPAMKARLRKAWASDNHALALDGLRLLADELEHSHPGAASSLREGLEETLTLTRLGIRGRLKKTLTSTNPIESMIEIIRRTSRNVKRWQSGDMCLRWTAAGMLEAETQFRKVVGYSDLAKLAVAVERDLLAQRTTAHTTTTEETPPIAVTV